MPHRKRQEARAVKYAEWGKDRPPARASYRPCERCGLSPAMHNTNNPGAAQHAYR